MSNLNFKNGGNALSHCVRLPAHLYNQVVSKFDYIIEPYFKFDEIGSSGKRSDSYGDIDMYLYSKEDWTQQESFKWLTDNLPYQYKIMKGLGICSFAIPFSNSDFVQVDFMFTKNPEWTKFVNWSPDLREPNPQSKYKGLYRSNLMRVLASSNLSDVTENSHWKMSLAKDCLKWQYKIATKSRKWKIDSKKDQVITTDPNFARIKLLGPNSSDSDCDSFESLWSYLNSDFFNKPLLPIVKLYVDYINSCGYPLPNEITEFLNNQKI